MSPTISEAVVAKATTSTLANNAMVEYRLPAIALSAFYAFGDAMGFRHFSCGDVVVAQGDLQGLNGHTHQLSPDKTLRIDYDIASSVDGDDCGGVWSLHKAKFAGRIWLGDELAGVVFLEYGPGGGINDTLCWTINFEVGSTSPIDADSLRKRVGELILGVYTEMVDEEPEDDGGTLVSFTYMAHGGQARAQGKRIYPEAWTELRGNYPAKVAGELDELISTTRDTARPGIILLYGPPGTGKTRFLSSLAKEWKGWCETTFVLDPSRLFTDPDYLLSAVYPALFNGYDNKPLLLVIEDAGDYLFGAAAEEALAKILNLADGVLGSSSKLMLMLTTNKESTAIAPSLTRPGRCIANVHLDKFGVAEARAWALAHDKNPDSIDQAITLAELYDL